MGTPHCNYSSRNSRPRNAIEPVLPFFTPID
jgi:hypothetical protein